MSNQPKTLNDWAKDIHGNAKDHGWWEGEKPFPEIVALCHSELSEALEEDREGRHMRYVNYGKPECIIICEGSLCENYQEDGTCGVNARNSKPEGIAVEMADCLIRILDWFGHEGLDVEAIVREKHEYNRTRAYRHGGKLA